MNQLNINLFSVGLFFIIFSFTACETDDPITQETCEESNIVVTTNPNYLSSGAAYQNDILVLNEGVFSQGTASLSTINGGITNNVFMIENNYALGDILQSATAYGEDLYLIINNSQKIEVLNRNNLSVKRTLSGFGSPRFMAFRDENTAAITDLYANKIISIDIDEGCIKDSFLTNGWTEQIEYVNGKFYVIERNNWGESDFANVLVLDDNLNLEQSIAVTIEANSMLVDADNNIWVLSGGKEDAGVYPALTKINTSNNQVEKTFTFTSYNAPTNLAYDQQGDNLYYNIWADVYKMSKNASDLPSSSVFTSGATYIYDMAVSPVDGSVYVSDAKDFSASGEVFVYDNLGEIVASYTTGVIPTEIVFP